MPFDYIGFVDDNDYVLSCNDKKTLFTITSKGFGYTITMNRFFQVVYLDSSLAFDDESPLEVCKCVNTLISYIKAN